MQATLSPSFRLALIPGGEEAPWGVPHAYEETTNVLAGSRLGSLIPGLSNSNQNFGHTSKMSVPVLGSLARRLDFGWISDQVEAPRLLGEPVWFFSN